MKNLKKYALVAVLGLAVVACSKKKAEEPKPEPVGGEVTVANVTYTNYVGDILTKKCNGCHGASGNAKGAWLFNGYASVKSDGTRLNNAMLVKKTMPPSGLSAKEQELLKAWFDKGLPQ